MDDKVIRRKLAQLVRICNELDDEAKRRYGQDGHVFFESEGQFHIMRGDVYDGTSTERQTFVEFESTGYCRLGAGAW